MDKKCKEGEEEEEGEGERWIRSVKSGRRRWRGKERDG